MDYRSSWLFIIRAIYLLLKFNLYLHREAVTARDRASAVCFCVQCQVSQVCARLRDWQYAHLA